MRRVAQISSLAVAAILFAAPHSAVSMMPQTPPPAADSALRQVNVTPGSELRWRPRANLAEQWNEAGATANAPDFATLLERARMFLDSTSQLQVGLAYYNGEGVEQDYGKAAEWLKLSAEQGNATAQAVLGFQYYAGAGVGRDLSEAHLWVSLALRVLPSGKGRRSVESIREVIRDELSLEQRTAADRRLNDWLSDAPIVSDR